MAGIVDRSDARARALEDHYAGYFDVVSCGGAESTVAVRWTESLYVADGPRHVRGDSNVIGGKRFIGRGDTFAPDRGFDRRITGLWWNCARDIQVRVRTADEPLTLQSVGFRETRYPLEMESSIALADKRFMQAVQVM